MPSLKEIKGRIASIQSTQKITSTMRMVSSAKLHNAQGLAEKFLPYRDQLEEIACNLSVSPSESNQREQKVCLIPISSNSGLCGTFNNNIAKATFQRVDELKRQSASVRLLPIGKKIAHELKKAGFESNLQYVNQMESVERGGAFADTTAFMEQILASYARGDIDCIEFIYHHFKSMGSQVITTTRLSLDMPLISIKKETEKEQWLTEPSYQALLTILFPRLLKAQAYGILLDSLTSEHATRMLAMQTADDNANDLLKELRLLYNKTRQQAITNELIDIMGGQQTQN